jgi:hypothetical protein
MNRPHTSYVTEAIAYLRFHHLGHCFRVYSHISVTCQYRFSDIRDVSVTAIHTYQYRFSSSKSVIFEVTKFTDIELAVIAIILDEEEQCEVKKRSGYMRHG